MKVTYLILSLLLFLSCRVNASLDNEFINVEHMELESKISCKNVGESISTCLKDVRMYSSPKAYIFKFELRVKKEIKEAQMRELTIMHAKQISALINPLTASFYDVSPSLLDLVDSSKEHPENIIIELDVKNNDKKYSAYLYPKVIKGSVNLIYNFFTGKVDAYNFLKRQCEKVTQLNDSNKVGADDVYEKSCVFTNL